jgi:pimeloyl-ACP methyl ester carboxylesterase
MGTACGRPDEGSYRGRSRPSRHRTFIGSDRGYDKKTQATDIRAAVTTLGFDRTFVVAHDIGNMVAYVYTATYPDKVERLVVMDAPIPGIEPWNEILLNPGVALQFSRSRCRAIGRGPRAHLL